MLLVETEAEIDDGVSSLIEISTLALRGAARAGARSLRDARKARICITASEYC